MPHCTHISRDRCDQQDFRAYTRWCSHTSCREASSGSIQVPYRAAPDRSGSKEHSDAASDAQGCSVVRCTVQRSQCERDGETEPVKKSRNIMRGTHIMSQGKYHRLPGGYSPCPSPPGARCAVCYPLSQSALTPRAGKAYGRTNQAPAEPVTATVDTAAHCYC